MMARNLILASLLLIGSLGAKATLGDCEHPGEKPHVPDGAVAPEQELAEASGGVRNFVAKTQDYLACLEARERELGGDITDDMQAEIVTTYNAAVETMQEVADNFNEQVRRFRERNDD